MGPAGYGVPAPEVLLDPEDWHSVRTVIDVGGGTGGLLAEVLRTRPSLRGTLVDLPRTGGPLGGPATGPIPKRRLFSAVARRRPVRPVAWWSSAA
jgi:hypothetical protein